MSKIYLASSWRNPEQPELVERLRAAGHEVYDYRNPQTGGPLMDKAPALGFAWSQCDPTWRSEGRLATTGGQWRETFRGMLRTPRALEGFNADWSAMLWADACVLALPCGRSAHLEAGWMAGAQKRLVVYLPESQEATFEPELMYLVGGDVDNVLALTFDEVLRNLEATHARRRVFR